MFNCYLFLSAGSYFILVVSNVDVVVFVVAIFVVVFVVIFVVVLVIV